jgi:hypothetical protein
VHGAKRARAGWICLDSGLVRRGAVEIFYGREKKTRSPVVARESGFLLLHPRPRQKVERTWVAPGRPSGALAFGRYRRSKRAYSASDSRGSVPVGPRHWLLFMRISCAPPDLFLKHPDVTVAI